jgi:antitoxin VapB
MTSSIVARMSKKRRMPDGGTARTRAARTRSASGPRPLGPGAADVSTGSSAGSIRGSEASVVTPSGYAIAGGERREVRHVGASCLPRRGRLLPMGLNIKNTETERLIRDLAEETGESLTDAVTVAVRERLERVRADFDVEHIMEIVRDIRSRVPPGFFDVDIDQLLYDEETGLPK